ncbi:MULTISPECIES: DnaJ C-terminal domain-containing protein [unclassified Kitasatospora]|uniref:DnaJ C-terminal domain-containing protein n=1 Tax=unclassified Kitasatospora TaxID=2633591 RepID=UPI0033F82D3A
MPDTVLGTTLTVPALDGDVPMTVPPGSRPGTVRIPGRGLPRRGTRGRDELHVSVTLCTDHPGDQAVPAAARAGPVPTRNRTWRTGTRRSSDSRKPQRQPTAARGGGEIGAGRLCDPVGPAPGAVRRARWGSGR